MPLDWAALLKDSQSLVWGPAWQSLSKCGCSEYACCADVYHARKNAAGILIARMNSAPCPRWLLAMETDIFLTAHAQLLALCDTDKLNVCRQGRQQAWQQRKKTVQQSELERRQAVLRAAEDDKMAQFRALAAAGPITIPERQ